MKKLFFALIVSALAFLTSCDPEETSKIILDVTNQSGYYVTNEGAFGKSNASIGFITKDGVYHDNLFEKTNNRVLGDVLQSMTVYNKKAYLIMNGSNKIEMMNANTFEELGTITGFKNPRYMTIVNNKSYVSQWGDGMSKASVKVINLTTNTIEDSITTGYGSEQMIAIGENLLVANSGGYGKDNTISIINTTTNEVSKTITLNDNNPKGFVVDKNNDIWVLCHGYIEYNYTDNTIASQTRSSLVKLAPTTFEPVTYFAISATQHPSQIGINKAGDKIYYGGGFGYKDIYEISITATTAPTTSLITGSFYGFSVNKANGEIACTESPSFSDNGSVSFYLYNGAKQSTFEAGIGPNNVIYKN